MRSEKRTKNQRPEQGPPQYVHLTLSQFYLPSVAGHLCTWDDLQDAIIGKIAVRDRANPLQIVRPSPRLLHFVDLGDAVVQLVRCWLS